jgi:hypothetical protein
MSNNILDNLLLIPLKSLYWFTVTFLPPWYNWWVIPIINLPLGVLPLVLHRAILNRKNLIAAPLPPPLKEPGPDLTYWPDDGVGVNRLNPQGEFKNKVHRKYWVTSQLNKCYLLAK